MESESDVRARRINVHYIIAASEHDSKSAPTSTNMEHEAKEGIYNKYAKRSHTILQPLLFVNAIEWQYNRKYCDDWYM